MLQIVAGDDHIAHLHALADAAGNAGEDDALRAKALYQCGGGGGGRHLADARERQHHRLVIKETSAKRAPSVREALFFL